MIRTDLISHHHGHQLLRLEYVNHAARAHLHKALVKCIVVQLDGLVEYEVNIEIHKLLPEVG